MNPPSILDVRLKELFRDIENSNGQPKEKSYIIDCGSVERAESMRKLVRESGIECYTNPLLNDGKTLYIPRKEVINLSLLNGIDPCSGEWEVPKMRWPTELRFK